MTSKGISLYFTILILSVLTASLLSLIAISVSQIKVIWTLSDSVSAFYTADTGIERALYRIRQQDNFFDFSGNLDSASYQVSIATTSEETVIKSIGSYKKTKRAIETRH